MLLLRNLINSDKLHGLNIHVPIPPSENGGVFIDKMKQFATIDDERIRIFSPPDVNQGVRI